MSANACIMNIYMCVYIYLYINDKFQMFRQPSSLMKAAETSEICDFCLVCTNLNYINVQSHTYITLATTCAHA